MTGVLVAMEKEFALLSRTSGACCALTGIGKVNAARAATELILEKKPDFVIGSGFAGAMAPGLLPGDVVLASRVAYHDVWCGEGNAPGQVQGLPRFFAADPSLLNLAREVLKERGLRYREGLVCSGDQFFVSLKEDERIRGLYPEVLAADMESAAIAQVCMHYRVPFLNMRFVSDSHGSEEEQEQTYSRTLSDPGSLSFSVLSDIINRL